MARGNMGDRARRRLRRALLALSALAILATSCAKNAPQDTLTPDGPIAREIDGLFKPVFWIAAAVFFLVEGLIVYAVLSGRRRKQIPVQIHGNRRLEIVLTLLPALLLGGIAIPTVLQIFDLSAKQTAAGTLNVKVIGHQWWWEYEYTDIKLPGGKQALKTANELHIPVGPKIQLEMTSADVIHAFWVPKLAGKQDVVPGHTNPLVIQADKPGEYLGQCAEFCALSHANMRLRVIAQPPDEFERWVAGQLREASLPLGADGARGGEIFAGMGNCWQCHTVRGLPKASAVFGPDLTHFASRGTFAGAIYRLNEEKLRLWLQDPLAAKPGSRMRLCSSTTADYTPPACIPKLSEEQISLLITFLMSLK